MYDFQGTCDQIAIDNCNIQVQIRTKPLEDWSTVTEVVVLFKASGETFRYSMNEPAGTGYTAENGLTDASGIQSVTQYGINYVIVIDAHNYIVMRGAGPYGINLEVKGSGAYMYGSVGMCGSWDHGDARFKDDAIFDTSGGYKGTECKSLDLAKDWQVPLDSSLLTDPSDTCDPNPSCGGVPTAPPVPSPGPAYPDCKETNCDKVTPDERKDACEKDIATTGDTSWACKYIDETSMPVITPSPNQFVPAPSDLLTDAPTPVPTSDPTSAPTPEPTPAPTNPPTAKPTRSPTQINHPCGTDNCQHTCVIRPGKCWTGLLLKSSHQLA